MTYTDLQNTEKDVLITSFIHGGVPQNRWQKIVHFISDMFVIEEYAILPIRIISFNCKLVQFAGQSIVFKKQ